MSIPAGILKAVDLRPGEGPRLLYLSTVAMLAVAEAIFIRTLSDALFLNVFPIDRLPFFFLASAVVFLPATWAYTWLRSTFASRRLHMTLLLCFAAISGLLRFCLGSPVAIFLTVLLLAIQSPLVNVMAWSSIMAKLNARDARRFVPLISAGATAGGIAAGFLAIPLIRSLGVAELLLPVMACNFLLAALVVRRSPPVIVPGTDDQPAVVIAPVDDSTTQLPPYRRRQEEQRKILENPLLMLLAGCVLLMALCSNLVDYAFKAELQHHFSKRLDEMGQFLGYYNALSNTITLLVQVFLVGRIMRKIGLRGSFALHPAILLLGLGFFLISPGLAMVALWKMADGLFKFTFHATSIEMALIPVPRILRDRGRALIKGALHPLGGFFAGLLLLVLGLVGSDVRLLVMPGLALAGGGWLVLTWQLRQRYLEQLRRSLTDANVVTVPMLQAIPAPTPVPAPPAAVPPPAAPDARASTAPGALLVQPVVDPDERVGTRTGVIRAVGGQVRRLQAAVAGGELKPDELTRSLDRLFELLGSLGDPGTVEFVRRHYQRGNLNIKAIAVELLELHLDDARVAEAVQLLDSLAPELVEQAARQRATDQRRTGRLRYFLQKKK